VSTLYLVRHAQASFLASDYDELSELGKVQAHKLGEHFARLELTFDRVYAGPRRRHRQTAEALLAGMRGAAEFESLGELDEYPADQVLAERLTELAAEHRELAADFDAEDPARRGRGLDRLLQAALRAWVDSPRPADPESWSAFSARARRALETVTGAAGRGQRILAVSSAGTIGRVVGHVLDASAGVSLDLGWMLNNSSVTEISFSAGRVGLSRFNAVAHLADPAEWTRR
jgi:broad specificity phosphatase PhoE